VKIDAVLNVDVPEVRAAIDFYERGIGLRLRRMLFNGTVAEMSGAPVPIFLIQKRPGTSPSPSISAPRDYARHWTPVHLDFPVPILTSRSRVPAPQARSSKARSRPMCEVASRRCAIRSLTVSASSNGWGAGTTRSNPERGPPAPFASRVGR